MKKYITWILGAFCALALVTSTLAADTNTVATVKAPAQSLQAESWTLTLGGAGATTTSGDSQTAVGVNVALGHTGHLLLPLELGVRQSLSYASNDGGNVVADTHLFSDWTLFTVKKVQLFAGGNAGATYGNTPLTWDVAPEVGVRYLLKKDVDLVGRVDYPFNLNDGRWDQTLRYFLGVRIKL
jgi:hypothetical protein